MNDRPDRPAAVRSATIRDAAVIAALAGELGYPVAAELMSARLPAVLADPDHVVFVCDDADGVHGWIHARVSRVLTGPTLAEITGLVVMGKYRRRGHGRVLVAAAIDWAGRRGVAGVRVRTRTSRSDAREFYRALGFRASKEQEVLDRPIAPDAEPDQPVACN